MFEKIIRDKLADYDTGRWDYDRVECCLTGKDADLEPWGQQGIRILGCDGQTVKAVAMIGKTFAGEDVCLNLPPEIEENDEAFEKAREAFLEQATEVVCGCGVPGEWTGDDWYLYDEVEFEVPVVYDPGITPASAGPVNWDKTVEAVVKGAGEALKGLEEELTLADSNMSDLAGWTEHPADGVAIRCKDGQPGRYAAWREDD